MNQLNQDLLNIWTRQLDIILLDIQNEPVKPGFVKHMDKTTCNTHSISQNYKKKKQYKH